LEQTKLGLELTHLMLYPNYKRPIQKVLLSAALLIMRE
jgi:hypothetical protein